MYEAASGTQPSARHLGALEGRRCGYGGIAAQLSLKKSGPSPQRSPGPCGWVWAQPPPPGHLPSFLGGHEGCAGSEGTLGDRLTSEAPEKAAVGGGEEAGSSHAT